MNYFGHAAVACHRSIAPPFVLGAMLPDLCAMVGIPTPDPDRLMALGQPDLAEGMTFHLRTDAVFHQTAMFTSHNQRAVVALRGLGINRGPARAAGHMGVEMLIDAVLVTNTRYLSAYQHALRWGSHALRHHTLLNNHEDLGWWARTKLVGLCTLLLERGATTFDQSVRRIADRLEGALTGRRLLAPTTHELTLISTWLAHDQAVGADVPQLLAELSSLTENALKTA